MEENLTITMEETLPATKEENVIVTMEKDVTVTMEENLIEEKKWWKKTIEKMRSWMTIKTKDKWLTNMRGNLSMVTTIIATISFQNTINPPGGVRSATESGYVKCKQILNGHLCPGQSVLAVIFSDEYVMSLKVNTICLASSLALLLVSDFPLHNRFFTCILSIGMCIILIHQVVLDNKEEWICEMYRKVI